jgi:hypothetical protein
MPLIDSTKSTPLPGYPLALTEAVDTNGNPSVVCLGMYATPVGQDFFDEHVYIVRVEEHRLDGHLAVDDPHNRLEKFYDMDDPHGPYKTYEVPGLDGDWVPLFYPRC